jgi:TonB family protein
MLSAEFQPEVAAPEAAGLGQSEALRPSPSNSTMLPVATLVGWLVCLVVGGLGFALPYTRPQAPAPEPVATQAELIEVALTSEPLPPVNPEPRASMTPPPLEALTAPAAVPPMTAVAQPSAEVAFALPVEGPTQVVPAAQASYSRSVQTNHVAAAPAVRSLTYGVGEGLQPAPRYPREAARTGQEGRVAVRFLVGENGHVTTAEAAKPSPWPLLNEEAVRTVRQRWRFRSGPVRLYEVTIRFELQGSRGES